MRFRVLQVLGCMVHGEGCCSPGRIETHIDTYDMALLCADASAHFFFGELRTRPVVRCCRAPFLEVGLLLRQLVGRAETPVGVPSLQGVQSISPQGQK